MIYAHNLRWMFQFLFTSRRPWEFSSATRRCRRDLLDHNLWAQIFANMSDKTSHSPPRWSRSLSNARATALNRVLATYRPTHRCAFSRPAPPSILRIIRITVDFLKQKPSVTL